MSSKITEVSQKARRVMGDVLTFVFQPIDFEFRRMWEESDDCLRHLDSAPLNQKEKEQCKRILSHTREWLEEEEHKHYHDFDHSQPIIDIRHQFTNKLQEARGQCGISA